MVYESKHGVRDASGGPEGDCRMIGGDERTPMTAPTNTSTSRYVSDIVERVLSTFVGAFGVLIASDAANFTTVGQVLNTGRSAAIAGFMAVVSLVKGMLAKAVGNADSASLSPKV